MPVENANFSRNFRFGNEGRYSLNLRVEFTNVFNRTQFPAINLGNFSTPPTKFTAGANTGLYSSGFGSSQPPALVECVRERLLALHILIISISGD